MIERLRPAVRDQSVLLTVAFVIGAATTAVGAVMTVPMMVSVFYAEWDSAFGIGLAAAVTIATGLVLWHVVGRSGPIGVREGFATVGATWFVLSMFGTLPYLFTGSIVGPTDAFFESASGFTTTGASILTDPGQLSLGIGVWRGLTQWMGGMGIIVLSVAILPLLGTGGVQLARAESPGHSPDRLTPRFQETAKRLWLVYVGFTVLLIVLLALGEMTAYQSVVHALTTMSTGGFGTEATSISLFSGYTQWVITIFMFLAGASFALHFRALRKPVEYLRDAELRLYTAIIVVAVVVVVGGLLRDTSLSDAVRDAAFSVVSIVTTTGFATVDFGSWRPALQILIVGLMFLGGMAGSTAGSVKTFRVGVLSKAGSTDLRRIVHPRGVFPVRFGTTSVPDKVVESVQSFFLFYMLLFVSGTFLLTFIDANVTERLDLVTAASAVASSLGNIGPGLGEVGPTGTYAAIPGLGKWLLADLMIIGRLEIFPVLLLFTRDLWHR
ncbi:MAG: TrkH family potassium uptake protein [Acidimicrobiia bacterium]